MKKRKKLKDGKDKGRNVYIAKMYFLNQNKDRLNVLYAKFEPTTHVLEQVMKVMRLYTYESIVKIKIFI